MSRDSFQSRWAVGHEPLRRRFGAKRDQNDNLMEGAPHSVRENGFGHGLTDDTAWASKFKQPAALASAPASSGPAVSPTASEADPYSFAPASRPVMPAATPAAAMPPSAERARFGDMGSIMETRVPGWSGLTPAERRAKLEAMPSPTSRGLAVGQVTGRSGYVSTPSDEAARIFQRYGGKGGTVTSARPANPDPMQGPPNMLGPTSVGEARKQAGWTGGAGSRVKAAVQAAATPPADSGAGPDLRAVKETPAAPAVAMPAGLGNRLMSMAGRVVSAQTDMAKGAVSKVKELGDRFAPLAIPGDALMGTVRPAAASSLWKAPGDALMQTVKPLAGIVAKGTPSGFLQDTDWQRKLREINPAVPAVTPKLAEVDPAEALRRKIQANIPRRQDKRVATN